MFPIFERVRVRERPRKMLIRRCSGVLVWEINRRVMKIMFTYEAGKPGTNVVLSFQVNCILRSAVITVLI